MVYLDHAATSNPKPQCVIEAMSHYASEGSANPGRGSHPLANRAARLLFETRERLKTFLGAEAAGEVVFTANVTEALNLALFGLLKPGDEVLVSSLEHNAMMRPLRLLEQQGVRITKIASDPKSGVIDLKLLAQSLSTNTKLVAINHASNAFGTLQPLDAIGELCRQHECLLLADCAQTAGHLPIDMASAKIDLLAFTGHKGLLGPMGTGGLIINTRAQKNGIKPLILGGTGSLSESENQPEFLPDALESGTPNLPGIAGLNAGVKWLQQQGINRLHQQELALCQRLMVGLSQLPNVRLIGPAMNAPRTAVVSFVIKGMDNGEVDDLLGNQHQIYCRTGLHCAPAAHRALGTFPEGSIRFSLGATTTAEDVDCAIAAVKAICTATVAADE
ncbi:aminotransferase class V-fold PLP-dependent enzyme [Ferrimonas aestuarii]|nr:aminotransferase class V-fold PLP-dependent enzyme [Ferrimonas aestuarii]